MFSLKRILSFWGRILRLIISLYAALALLTLLLALARGKPTAAWQLALYALIGLLPATLAIIAAFALSTSFQQELYGLKGKREAFWHIVHCMFGQTSLKPWLIVEQGKLATKSGKPDSFLALAGGPGSLVVRKDTAIILEQHGALTRVVGPGLQKLERFESIYDLVDLRPQRWSQFTVSGMSKEGIPVELEADVHFQIQDGGKQPTVDQPFPADLDAVFLASTSKWIRSAGRLPGGQVLDWRERAVAPISGKLRSILARYPLDRLIAPEKATQRHPRQAIRSELEQFLQSTVRDLGVKLLKVELGQIRVRDEVTQEWIESWRADWDRWEVEYLADAEADGRKKLNKARSEVMIERIRDSANILHDLAQTGRQAFVRGALMQLHMALRNVGSDSLALTYLPAEATKLLQGATK